MTLSTKTHEKNTLYLIKKSICSGFRVKSIGESQIRVTTPFMYGDGDLISFSIMSKEDSYLLSDNGNTFLHLSYDFDERDISETYRGEIIERYKKMFDLKEKDGELYKELNLDEISSKFSINNYIQGLLKIESISSLEKKVVSKTFLDDLKVKIKNVTDSLTEKTGKKVNCNYNFIYPEDAKKTYPIDIHIEIEGAKLPLEIFALKNDQNCQKAIISILMLRSEKFKKNFHAIGVFRNAEKNSRRVLNQIIDVCDKNFSELPTEEKLEDFLERAVPELNLV